MVSVFASFNLPLHHKSRSSPLALAHPGGPRKRAVKWLWVLDIDTRLMASFPGQPGEAGTRKVKPPPQPFYGPFSRTTWLSWCQKRTSGLYGARED